MTPIERAARAMCAKSVELDMGDGQSWKVLVEVALKAIREPSEPMKAAAAEIAGFSGYYGDDPENREAARICWQAMIDKAKEEG